MRIKLIHIIFLFFVITAFVIIERIDFPVPKGWPKYSGVTGANYHFAGTPIQ
jgi:hypothetical protein